MTCPETPGAGCACEAQHLRLLIRHELSWLAQLQGQLLELLRQLSKAGLADERRVFEAGAQFELDTVRDAEAMNARLSALFQASGERGH